MKIALDMSTALLVYYRVMRIEQLTNNKLKGK